MIYELDLQNLKTCSIKNAIDFVNRFNKYQKSTNNLLTFTNKKIYSKNLKFYEKFINYMNIGLLEKYPLKRIINK